MTRLEETIYQMMTTSTGTNLLDSGGASGRHWQHNQKLSIDDFKNQPPAILEFYGDSYPEYTVNVFHKLTDGCIELDDLCEEFNAMECNDWDGYYYGTSISQYGWLSRMGFNAQGEGFNTYNWGSNLSQTLQGQELTREDEYGIEENYILIQIHQGADVRGGYTDAKLFKVGEHSEPYAVYIDDATFAVEDTDGDFIYLDHCGDWRSIDDRPVDDEFFKQFATLANNKPVIGDIISYC